MQPLPETLDALDEIVSVEEPDPEHLLEAVGSAVRDIVPQLTGLSLALLREQITLTLVASHEEVAALKAQHLGGGSATRVDTGRDHGAEPRGGGDPLDEVRWDLVARSDTATGVASTLSVPLRLGDVVIGSVHMYAATVDAFAGHVDELERLLGATHASAVMN